MLTNDTARDVHLDWASPTDNHRGPVCVPAGEALPPVWRINGPWRTRGENEGSYIPGLAASGWAVAVQMEILYSDAGCVLREYAREHDLGVRKAIVTDFPPAIRWVMAASRHPRHFSLQSALYRRS